MGVCLGNGRLRKVVGQASSRFWVALNVLLIRNVLGVNGTDEY